MNPIGRKNLNAPLLVVLAKTAGIWIIANLGYFFVLPLAGISLSYNSSPVANAVYFFLWAIASVWYFWDLFSEWLLVNARIWLYVALSMGSAGVLWAFIFLFSLTTTLRGPILAPYTDLLLATPWYFLPKATEILLQQVLIAALVLALWFRFKRLPYVVASYALTFGLAHATLFLFQDMPIGHSIVMTTAAVLSALVFPYLMLRVRGGFVYTYILHLFFYIVVAMILHTWPPPGYMG